VPLEKWMHDDIVAAALKSDRTPEAEIRAMLRSVMDAQRDMMRGLQSKEQTDLIEAANNGQAVE
jgi:hypothetical protein